MTEIIIVIVFYLSILMILLNILYLMIKLGYLMIREHPQKEYKSKTKIIKSIVKRLRIVLSLIMIFLMWNEAQKRSFYCLDDDKCITVWYRTDGICYIIFDKYYGVDTPKNNYIKTYYDNAITIIIDNSTNYEYIISNDYNKKTEIKSSKRIKLQ